MIRKMPKTTNQIATLFKINHITNLCLYCISAEHIFESLENFISYKNYLLPTAFLSLSSSRSPAALPPAGRHFPAVLDVYLTFDVVAARPRAWGPIKTNNPQGPPTIPRTHPFVASATFCLTHYAPLLRSSSPAKMHLCSYLMSSFVILISLLLVLFYFYLWVRC